MNAKESVIELKNLILRLLGPTGINSLGQYNLIVGGKPSNQFVPAIKIRLPALETSVIYKISPQSGVEAILDPEPNQQSKYASFGNVRMTRHWTLTLDQHNPNKTLTDSIEIIYQSPRIVCTQPAIIRPVQKTAEGIIPSRALIFIAQPVFHSSL